MEYQAEESVSVAVKGIQEIERVIAKHISEEVSRRTEERVGRYAEAVSKARLELESMTHCYKLLEAERARVEKLVADMHAAALGEIRGPIRGAVEDVKHLRVELEKTREERDMKIRDVHWAKAELNLAKDMIAGLEKNIVELKNEIHELKGSRLGGARELSRIQSERDELRSLVQTLVEKSAKVAEKKVQALQGIADRGGPGLGLSIAISRVDEETGCIAGTERPLKTQADRILDLERTLREIEERVSKPTPFDVFGTLESIRWLARKGLVP